MISFFLDLNNIDNCIATFLGKDLEQKKNAPPPTIHASNSPWHLAPGRSQINTFQRFSYNFVHGLLVLNCIQWYSEFRCFFSHSVLFLFLL